MKLHLPQSLRLWFVLVLGSLPVTAAETPPARPPHALIWDAMELTVVAKPGEKEAKFQFHVTNKSGEPVEVVQIEASCGCTVAEMPSTPWILAAGAKGSFTAVVDFLGKYVCPHKVDGRYLPELNGGGVIWNWRP